MSIHTNYIRMYLRSKENGRNGAGKSKTVEEDAQYGHHN